ncbi:conserved hypothetical protein, partial [Ricinus communis]
AEVLEKTVRRHEAFLAAHLPETVGDEGCHQREHAEETRAQPAVNAGHDGHRRAQLQRDHRRRQRRRRRQ